MHWSDTPIETQFRIVELVERRLRGHRVSRSL
jgi:hypothetical protein